MENFFSPNGRTDERTDGKHNFKVGLANVLQFFSEMLFQVESSELMLNFPDLVRTE